ncbi:unnamed protein product, partial [Dicrocoelium dendriticum]
MLLTDLFNRCLHIGIIPDIWRPISITPVPKKESTKFRPIAYTFVMLKVFERLLVPWISTSSPAMGVSQFAYRPRHSTLDAVAYLSYSITSSLDAKCENMWPLFIDYANALDSVDRSILLNQLPVNGVQPAVCNRISEYFVNRSQLNGKGPTLLVMAGTFYKEQSTPLFFSPYIEIRPIPSTLLDVSKL